MMDTIGAFIRFLWEAAKASAVLIIAWCFAVYIVPALIGFLVGGVNYFR